MINTSDLYIPGYLPEEPFNSNTTSKLRHNTYKNTMYIDVYKDDTEELITRIPLNDILDALSDIIR